MSWKLLQANLPGYVSFMDCEYPRLSLWDSRAKTNTRELYSLQVSLACVLLAFFMTRSTSPKRKEEVLVLSTFNVSV